MALKALKTRQALRRNGALIARINRGRDYIKRSRLNDAATSNRHCMLYLQMACRAGFFHPPGGARVRGEP